MSNRFIVSEINTDFEKKTTDEPFRETEEEMYWVICSKSNAHWMKW
jgi:hypothetical protein